MTIQIQFKKLQKENEQIRKDIKDTLEHSGVMSFEIDLIFEYIYNLINNEIEQEELYNK